MKLTREQIAEIRDCLKNLEQALEQCERLRDEYQTEHADLPAKKQESEAGEQLQALGEAFEMASDRVQDAIDQITEYGEGK